MADINSNIEEMNLIKLTKSELLEKCQEQSETQFKAHSIGRLMN